MNLYLVHCGFYDPDLRGGIYESHVNYFVAAETFEAARAKVKVIPEFKARRMHVDGLEEIRAANGYRISLEEDPALEGETLVVSNKHRDLAPQPAAPTPSSPTTSH